MLTFGQAKVLKEVFYGEKKKKKNLGFNLIM